MTYKVKYIKYQILILLTAFALPAQSQEQIQPDISKDFSIMKHDLDNYWTSRPRRKGSGRKQYERWLEFWSPRIAENGKFPDGAEVYDELKAFKDRFKVFSPNFALWKSLGPNTVPENKLAYPSSGNGRINCIRFNPKNTKHIWAGSASGGIWKSTNGGMNWHLLDFTDILSIGISDIAVSPANPAIAYAATGDSNGWGISGGLSVGIIKTTDGGTSWSKTNKYSLHENQALTASLIIDSANPDVLTAGTSTGVYQTIDGGNTWFKTLDKHYIRDLEKAPDSSNVFYAASYNIKGNASIFRSEDGAQTWSTSLIVPLASRITLAVSPADPDVIYALCVNKNTFGFLALYKSTNKGKSWNIPSTSPNILSIDTAGLDSLGQGNYDLAMAVHPKNADFIYIGGIHIWKSKNGGVDWSLVTNWRGDKLPFVHADQHELVFKPNSYDLYSGNDGGIVFTRDSGKSFIDISEGICVTQFYRAGTSSDGSIIAGGSQDNGVLVYKNDKWIHSLGGDAMECAVSPDNSAEIYAVNYYGLLNKSIDSGNTFTFVFDTQKSGEESAWAAPFEINKFNNSSIYIAHENIWKSEDRGKSWSKWSNLNFKKPIDVFCTASNDTNIMYIAIDNFLYKSINSGKDWQFLWKSTQNISDIEVSDENSQLLWVSLSGYYRGEKIYRIENDKAENFSFNMPNIPVNTLVHHRNSHGNVIYAGTDFGVFRYDKYEKDWLWYNDGMSNTAVFDLDIDYNNNKLIAATFGNGIKIGDLVDLSGVEEEKKSAVQIYPIPADDEINITIDIESAIDIYCAIINEKGELCKEINITDKVNKLNIKSLNSGVYFAVVKNGKSKEAVKFIKR